MFFKIVFFSLFFLVFGTSNIFAAPSVVVSIAPLHSIVSVVMDGVGNPELLLSPAVSVHEIYLKPSDIRRLTSADLFFWGGSHLENGLSKFLQAAEKQNESIAFMEDSRMTLFPVRDANDTFHTDGHFWLMPENMAVVALIAAEHLSLIDPENKELYHKNAKRVQKEIIDLKKTGKTILEPYKQRPYVVFHDAYQYFEKSFDFPALGALFVDPHHVAGAFRISSMREKIKQAGKVCVFSEPQFSDKKIKSVTEGLSVVLGELDPSGTKNDIGKEFYSTLMKNIYHSLKECFERLSEEKGKQNDS